MGDRFELERHNDVVHLLLALVIAVGLLSDATGALASMPKKSHRHGQNHGARVSDRGARAPSRRRAAARRVHVPPAPSVTSSRYMTHANGPRSFGLGCALGWWSRRGPRRPDALVVLDYGAPMHHKGRYGTSAFGPFRTTRQIAHSAEEYARGFARCAGRGSHSHLRLGIGTSNYGRDVTFRHGQLWGMLVHRVSLWLSSHRLSGRVQAFGANDIEPGWRGPTATRRWIRGYASRTRK